MSNYCYRNAITGASLSEVSEPLSKVIPFVKIKLEDHCYVPLV